MARLAKFKVDRVYWKLSERVETVAIIIVFDRRRSKIENGYTGEERERVHLKVKHINSVLEKIHEYNIEAYIKGGGNHDKTFRNHME